MGLQHWVELVCSRIHRHSQAIYLYRGKFRHLYGNLDDTSYGNCRKLRQNCSALFIKTYMVCKITFYSMTALLKQNE